MDRRAKINLREEAAGGFDAGLPEGAGHIQQQVREVSQTHSHVCCWCCGNDLVFTWKLKWSCWMFYVPGC